MLVPLGGAALPRAALRRLSVVRPEAGPGRRRRRHEAGRADPPARGG